VALRVLLAGEYHRIGVNDDSAVLKTFNFNDFWTAEVSE
jgi:hypothetical protein